MASSPSFETTVIPVRHPAWSDSLHFHDDLFNRAATGCTGRFEILPDGCVFLKWDRWKPEILGSSGMILSLDQYANDRKWSPLELPETWSGEDPGSFETSVVTFSRERLNHLCSLIACMKAQSEKRFIHVVHAVGYTGEQYRFLKQMIAGDQRFILRETVVMSQKEHLLHALADARRLGAARLVKIDDDDLYAPAFLGTILQESRDHDFTAGTSLLIHSPGGNRTHLSLHNRQFGNNMCFSPQAVDFLLAAPNRPECRFEDSFAHHTLLDAGFKVHTFDLAFPEILYLRHGGNVSVTNSP